MANRNNYFFMSKIKILIEGYAKENKDGWLVSPSTVLIEDSGLKILVDPGANKKLLLKNLAAAGLKPKDIDRIFVTHYHLDHILNIRLFPDCPVLDGNEINQDDKITDYSGKIPGTKIKVIPTPGHAAEHASLLVETAEGIIAIAGDLFWWEDSEARKTDRASLLKKVDPYVKDKMAIRRSREKILAAADFIIPGHGKMFKVEK
jgi:glyoxylase-like metal-dependent hydrolase (beta-lactamase superfamily II)